jgi:NTE family protein
VIEALLSGGYSVERIVGVSIGSLAGALYAFDTDIAAVQKRSLEYLLSPGFQKHQLTMFGASPRPGEAMTGGIFSWYDRIQRYLRANRMFHRVVRNPSLLPGIVLEDVVTNLLPDANVEDAKIPLSIVAVDLRSGHKVILEKGPLRKAVQASASLPAIFPPVEFGGMLLCDVGVFYSLPTTEARAYATRKVVAVDVSTDLMPLPKCDTAFDVLMRMDEIGESLFRRHVRSNADYVIRPDVTGVEWFDFSSCRKLVESGRRAGRQMISEAGEALG